MKDMDSKHHTKLSSTQCFAGKVPIAGKWGVWGHAKELVINRLKRV
jgi:hypothetical protein